VRTRQGLTTRNCAAAANGRITLLTAWAESTRPRRLLWLEAGDWNLDTMRASYSGNAWASQSDGVPSARFSAG